MDRADSGKSSRVLLAGGVSGLAAAAIGLVCCATPALAMILGALGLGAATGTAGTTIDVVAMPLAIVSLCLIGGGIYLRRRRAVDTP